MSHDRRNKNHTAISLACDTPRDYGYVLTYFNTSHIAFSPVDRAWSIACLPVRKTRSHDKRMGITFAAKKKNYLVGHD